jgi:two-component system, cell cycle response regulator DivK
VVPIMRVRPGFKPILTSRGALCGCLAAIGTKRVRPMTYQEITPAFQAQSREQRPAHGEQRRRLVLIVEDNELNMKLFRDLLTVYGYKTIETRRGLEALVLARQHRPDLILMDIQLPEVSGLEVTKWLKDDDELARIPVVAVTAFAMKGDEQRIRQGGCEAYLSKPIAIAAFIEMIRRFAGEALIVA